ncbi:MAG: hypothetical protein K0R98_407 [Rickettsiaceae bacterium]|jgi:hypothetical protein|nr:hypothetical protein [Rickettsiaceae bacterium]
MGNKNLGKEIGTLLISLLLLTACQNSRLDITGMPHPPKEGPPEYIAGWKAGCETGMTSYSSDYLRTRYSTNVDGHMMEDPYYNKGWELGQSYCSYYVSSYLSNKEFASNDLRSNDTWFNLKSDGFFSYKGIDKFSW